MPEYTQSDLPARIAEKIAQRPDGCWEWTAYAMPSGYGRVGLNGRVWYAHRATYTLLVGDIPADLVIDHLCRNRRCVNPAHLRAVTQRENVLAPGSQSVTAINAAKVTCALGHRLTEYRGTRRCRTCGNAKSLEYQARLRELHNLRAAKVA